MTVEEIFSKASTMQKVGIVFGCLCFICIGTFVLLHLGFTDTNAHMDKPINFLSSTELILINCGLGLLGGFLLNFKRPVLSALCGLFAAISLTVFAFLYSFWRETIYNFEMIIVLGIGILPGLALYKLLIKFSRN